MASDPRPDPPAQPSSVTARAPPDTLPPQGTARPGGATGGAPAGFAAGSRPLPEYELISLLGRGGFGEVWKATGPGGFEVALKFIRLGEQAGAVELRSLELMKGIRHAHLLPMFGAWQRDDLLVIAMELAERTLWDRWREVAAQGLPGIPFAEMVVYLQEAAKGLDFLNERRHPSALGEVTGIQHKDIKPQNLLLVGGTVKVADFGLARMLEQTIANASGGLTPGYAAPEFFQGKVTRWSDQYCLAVSYCLLRGGRLPFEGSAMQVMAGHVLQPPDLSMLPEGERPAVARALAKDPERRWPTCRDFAESVASSSGSGAQALAIAAPAVGQNEFAGSASTRAPAPIMVPAPEGPSPSRRRVGAVGLVASIVLPALAAMGVVCWQNPQLLRRGNTDAAAAPVTTAVNSPVPPGATPQSTAAKEAVPEKPAPMVAPEVPAPPAVLRLMPVGEAVVETGKRGFIRMRVLRQDCTGPVRLEVVGLPEGVRADAATIAGDREGGRIPLQAGDDALGCAKTVRVRAELGEARAEQSVLLTVRVTPSLRLLPLDDLTMQARQVRTVAVRVRRRNLSGPVDLRLEGLPEAVKAQPGTVPAGTAVGRLELRVLAKAVPQTRAVRVIAEADGLLAEGTFRLTIGPVRTMAELAAECSDAIRRYPGEAGNYCDRGRFYFDQKEYQKAVANFTEAVRLDPDYAAAYYNRGTARVRTHDCDGAIADCGRAIALDPRSAAAYNCRGVARVELKEYDKALEDYNDAIRLDPHYAIAFSNRGNAYVALKEQDKAMADYDKAAQLDPQYALTYIGRGNLFRARKQPDRAMADYEKAVQLDPFLAVGYNNRGTIHRDRKEYDKAVADYTEAIRLDPRYALAYTNRAHAYELKGDAARAKADREKAAALNSPAGK
jgi:tetratricopeptide (TPR) repeat protein